MELIIIIVVVTIACYLHDLRQERLSKNRKRVGEFAWRTGRDRYHCRIERIRGIIYDTWYLSLNGEDVAKWRVYEKSANNFLMHQTQVVGPFEIIIAAKYDEFTFTLNLKSVSISVNDTPVGKTLRNTPLPVVDLPGGTGTQKRATDQLWNIKEVTEREVLVARCKYCGVLTPVDLSSCKHCGASDPI